jgi:transcriptional regulator with XRE-family HTH domain
MHDVLRARRCNTCKLLYDVLMPGSTRHASPDTLGAAVRRLREQAGRSIREVSDQLGWSGSKLSRIETGHSGINGQDLDRLLVLYDASPDEKSRIGALTGTLPPSRIRRLPYALSAPSERHIALEAKASEISIYGAGAVPALLQPPEYAAAMIRADPLSNDQVQQARIKTRLVRQAVLAHQPGPKLNIIIDEVVLRRRFGDPSIMCRQMHRLIEARERSLTSIRVVPFDADTNLAQIGHFAILDFNDGNTPPYVYSDDGLSGGTLSSKPEDVDRSRLCFEKIADVALDEDGSVHMFENAKDDWAQQRTATARSGRPVAKMLSTTAQ